MSDIAYLRRKRSGIVCNRLHVADVDDSRFIGMVVRRLDRPYGSQSEHLVQAGRTQRFRRSAGARHSAWRGRLQSEIGRGLDQVDLS